MNKSLATFSLFVTLISLIAAASSAAERPKPNFIKTVDKNADGKVNQAEFFAAMEKKFHSMDVDKSEIVSVEELKLYGEKDEAVRQKIQLAASPDQTISADNFVKLFAERGEQEFALLDKNHDNALTADEVSANQAELQKNPQPQSTAAKKISKKQFIALFTDSAQRHLDSLDKNYDDRLTADELGWSKSKPTLKPAPSALSPLLTQPELAKQIQPEPDAQKAAQQKFIKSFFVGIDANNDGQISQAEKIAAFTQLFNRLDTNHDRLITEDEIIAGRHSAAAHNP